MIFNLRRRKNLSYTLNGLRKTKKADCSPEFLKMLGKWFEENVETEKLSEEEYKEKRAAVPDEIEIQDRTLQ